MGKLPFEISSLAHRHTLNVPDREEASLIGIVKRRAAGSITAKLLENLSEPLDADATNVQQFLKETRFFLLLYRHLPNAFVPMSAHVVSTTGSNALKNRSPLVHAAQTAEGGRGCGGEEEMEAKAEIR